MAKPDATKNLRQSDARDPGRRDFIVVATYAMAGLGAAAVAWPLIDQLNPAADTLALANIEVDISKISVGQSITVKWRGKPVFIRHRTSDEIARANATDVADLRDPQDDKARAEKPEFLVLVGVCTHLGCVPLGQKTGEVKGIMTAGSVHVMGRITTHPAVSAKGRRRQILRFHRMISYPTL